MSSAPICHLTSCLAWNNDLQYPEDSFLPFGMLEINVKATFIKKTHEGEERGGGGGGGKKLVNDGESGCRRRRSAAVVREESHSLPLDQLVAYKDWQQDTNIWDVFHSMKIPIQCPALESIVGCAVAMAGDERYKNRKVLRMRVEIETLVNDDDDERLMMNFEEDDDEDVYSVDVEAVDFWETVAAFGKLRTVVVAEDNRQPQNLCSICLGEFLVGSEISATPCSHIFHARCIRAWLKKCDKKFCPNCVTFLA